MPGEAQVGRAANEFGVKGSPDDHPDHAGICVADIDEALRFYRDGVGLNLLVDKVIEADLESLLGVHTRRVRTVFLGATDRPDGG